LGGISFSQGPLPLAAKRGIADHHGVELHEEKTPSKREKERKKAV
jgi:hypothetical protein